MARPKLDFEINPSVMDDLITISKKLPLEATRGYTKDGQGDNFDHPAGLALLGMKESLVDTVIPLRMSGGCWDAPNINFEDMDIGLRKMISADRICAGMALVRHPKWNTHASESEKGKIPHQLKYQLHSLRNSFTDITKTAWIVLQNDYFRIYRPTKSETGKVGCIEVGLGSLFSEDTTASKIIDKKRDLDGTRKARLEAAKIKRAADLKARLEANKKENERLEAVRQAKIEKDKKKQEELNARIKDGKESIIDMGGGFCLMKDKKGEYILWKNK
jgi:hypothetical protein